MPKFHLEHLNRNEYIDSISQIKDKKSIGFANLALDWWDRHFSWKVHGCITLCNDEQEHLSYIFYKIDRYNEYITVHNVFTPLSFRRHGYASELFELVFQIAADKNVSRFRITCIPQSLDFYLTLGFVYWGINSQGDYYCDLPLPGGGVSQIDKMVKDTDTKALAGDQVDTIVSKVKGNVENLDDVQTAIYEKQTEKLAGSYLYNELMKIDDKT